MRAVTGPEICRLLANARVPLHDEIQAHVAIETLLKAGPGALSFQREYRLAAGDIPDFFFVGGVVLEVKLRTTTKMNVYRQLERYAGHDVVTAIVLATNLSMGLPPTIGGKPAYYVSLGRGWM
jgi:hypothetical protein